MPTLLRSLAFLALAIGTVGCASSGPATDASSGVEMAAAEQAVARARDAGAETQAPTEFRAATSRLAQAQAALDAGDTARAARLAREATIDGRLAEAAVIASRASRRAEVVADVEALRAEQ